MGIAHQRSLAVNTYYKNKIAQQERLQTITELRETVRRGEAGEAIQRLFAEDHEFYLERAKAGVPEVRPLDEDVYDYLNERAGAEVTCNE